MPPSYAASLERRKGSVEGREFATCGPCQRCDACSPPQPLPTKWKRPASSSARSTGRRRRPRSPTTAPTRRPRNSPASTRKPASAFPASPRAACRCCCRSTSTPCARMSPPASRRRDNVGQIFRPLPSLQTLPAGARPATPPLSLPITARFAFKFPKPVEIEITGGAFVYDLDGPDHQEVFPAKELQDQFPGIQRILREAHVRYAFERFGVPYVRLDPVLRSAAILALSVLQGGRSGRGEILDAAAHRRRHAAGHRHAAYRSHAGRPRNPTSPITVPGNLIPDTGWHKMPGRADYHVYARMRLPIADAPAYVKSQSFMPWGDCYRTGHSGRLGRKDARVFTAR